MSSNLARDRATEAELLHLLFPDGIGNMSVETFRAYLHEFLIFYRALLSESGDEEYLDRTGTIPRDFLEKIPQVDPMTRQCVQNALNRRG